MSCCSMICLSPVFVHVHIFAEFVPYKILWRQENCYETLCLLYVTQCHELGLISIHHHCMQLLNYD